MTFNSWMNKQTAVHSDNKILSIGFKKALTLQKDMEEP